ncbi:MauE/DoxX family redox-associated membrane protein [Kiritimatiellota bacterium B12222]|nr:MauE/DoxX family redox-associated membrane protein [Kiritimatiellota bacterium B12222]
MMNKALSSWMRRAPRGVISALFLYSGGVKVVDLEAFATAVQGYQLLPEPVIIPLAVTLAWLELWCGLALWITPPFRKAAWCWITLLLLVFTVAKISVLQRGIAISCGCSGSGALMTWADVWINILWLALCAVGLKFDRR